MLSLLLIPVAIFLLGILMIAVGAADLGIKFMFFGIAPVLFIGLAFLIFKVIAKVFAIIYDFFFHP